MRENGPVKILLVESDFDHASEIRETMVAHDASWFESIHAVTLAEALRYLKSEKFDVILLSQALPAVPGETAFQNIFVAARSVPIIVMTDLQSSMQAIKMLQRGAQDYLLKGQLGGSGLKRLIIKAIECNRGMTSWDETERQRQHELENLINHDPLTGLYNRRHLRERLVQEMFRCERGKSPLTVMVVQIDRMDEVLKRYGQETADQVLVTLSVMLKHRLRVTDVISRYDPDLLCALLPDTDLEGADVTANRIRVRIEKQPHLAPDGSEFTVTCSFGLAAFDKTVVDTVALIKRASVAREQAWKAGGNRVVGFTKS